MEIVRTVHKKGAKTIEDLCARGEQVLGQDNNLLREAWKQDVLDRLDYEKDQHKSG